jgi:hypothetical protein
MDCVVMLEPPLVAGQAYPYRNWAAAPPASEEGYLLLSPLRPGLRPFIHRLSFTPPHPHEEARAELVLTDGRIYRLDRHLRPLSCTVGDSTEASRLAPTRPMAPLLYLRDGRREFIDLPVRRGAS